MAGNSSEYNHEYYMQNRDKISARKRKKYLEDPEYADRQRTRSRLAMRKRREKMRKERKEHGQKEKNRQAPFAAKVDIGGGNQVEVLMYYVGALAKRMQRSVKTIYMWEQKKIIPKAMFRDTANRRLYTEDQVVALCDALKHGMNSRTGRSWLPELRKAFHEAWNQLPNGVKVQDEQ